jgi:integrase
MGASSSTKRATRIRRPQAQEQARALRDRPGRAGLFGPAPGLAQVATLWPAALAGADPLQPSLRLEVGEGATHTSHRRPITSEPKTSRGRRSIALDPRTVTALRSWRAAQLEERLAWGPAYRDSGLVFTREDGTPLHPEWLSDAFAWRIRTAGLSPIRFHDLRHTHASLGLAAGVPIKVMSERLGHSTSSFTADAYQHVTPALEEQAAATVARLVFGP